MQWRNKDEEGKSEIVSFCRSLIKISPIYNLVLYRTICWTTSVYLFQGFWFRVKTDYFLRTCWRLCFVCVLKYTWSWQDLYVVLEIWLPGERRVAHVGSVRLRQAPAWSSQGAENGRNQPALEARAIAQVPLVVV